MSVGGQEADPLTELQSAAPETAVIVLADQDDEQLALQALRQGAQDYLVKGKEGPSTIVRILRYAMERKRAQDALQESEAKYRTISELISDIAYSVYVEPDGMLVPEWATQDCIRDTQLTIEDIRSPDGLARLTHSEDLPRLRQFTKSLLAGQPGSIEFRIVNLDGETRWIRNYSQPIWAVDHSRVIRIIGAAQDITEQKRAEQALQESQSRYHSLFEDSPLSLWEEDWSQVKGFFDRVRGRGVTDLRMFFQENPQAVAYCAGLVRLVDINQATLRMHKANSKSELLNRLEDVFTEETMELFREELCALASGARHFEAETPHRTLADETIYVALQVNVAPGYEDSLGKVLVSMADITERKLAEQERNQLLDKLQRHSVQLETAAQVSKSASVILDPDQLIEQAVSLIREHFGFYYVGLFLSDEEQEYAVLRAGTGQAGQHMLAKGHRLQIGDTSMIGWCVANAQARIAQNVGGEEIRFDNPYLPDTRSEMALPLLSHGHCIGAITVQSDSEAAFSREDIASLQVMAEHLAIAIENARLYDSLHDELAERKQAEESLRQRTAELQERNEDLDAFAHIVAHDLKSPLALITGYADLVNHTYEDLSSEEIQRHLKQISQTGHQMDNIINELLLLAGVRHLSVEMQPLDMARIVAQAQERVAHVIQERQAQIELPSVWPTAKGYGPWVEEIWVNYLSNALDYGGHPPHVALGADTEPDGMVMFWIHDNGEGISQADQELLFQPFTQPPQSISKGHGLGLSIVKSIVEKLGGQVDVESKPGCGSTFSFTLPSADGTEHLAR
jgi:signal transduction histidine kinase/PAS domain-containing protein